MFLSPNLNRLIYLFLIFSTYYSVAQDSFGSVEGFLYNDIDCNGSYDTSIDQVLREVDVIIIADEVRSVESDSLGVWKLDNVPSGDVSVFVDRFDLEGCFNLGEGQERYDFTLNDGDEIELGNIGFCHENAFIDCINEPIEIVLTDENPFYLLSVLDLLDSFDFCLPHSIYNFTYFNPLRNSSSTVSISDVNKDGVIDELDNPEEIFIDCSFVGFNLVEAEVIVETIHADVQDSCFSSFVVRSELTPEEDEDICDVIDIIYLNEFGEIEPLFDFCTGIMYEIIGDITCDDAGNEVDVIIRAYDIDGVFLYECEDRVLVLDIIAPEMICRDITLNLNDLPSVSLNPQDVDNGSFDNCSIESLSVFPNTFNTIGEYEVVLTGIDPSGNRGSCTSIVNVVDVEETEIYSNIYFDDNGNGVQDECEPGISDVQFNINNNDDTLISYEIYTNLEGIIEESIIVGSYSYQADLSSFNDYYITQGAINSNFNNSSDIILEPIGVFFPERAYNFLDAFVYLDLNRNGFFDDNEEVIKNYTSNINITLNNGDDFDLLVNPDDLGVIKLKVPYGQIEINVDFSNLREDFSNFEILNIESFDNINIEENPIGSCLSPKDVTFKKSLGVFYGLKIYNAVSPNNDGLNDYLRIDGVKTFSNNNIQIVNRWGETVFEMSQYNNEDRSFKGYANKGLTSTGKLLPKGVYYYFFNYLDKETTKQLKGYININ